MEIEAWRLYLALYYVVCIGMTIFCLDGGHADEPSREASPDLGAAGAELEDESAQAGAVQGPETLRSQVSRQCQEIDLHDLFEGVREVQMVLDLHGSVGGDVNGLQGSVPLGRYHRALVFLLGGGGSVASCMFRSGVEGAHRAAGAARDPAAWLAVVRRRRARVGSGTAP